MADSSPSDISGVIIPLIVLIVLIIFIGIIFYYIAISGFTRTGNGLQVPCPLGQCATNLQNGFKRCPVPNSDQPIIANTQNEVCNSPYTCDNIVTPFAVQSDGSTNFLGACDPAGSTGLPADLTACPCLTVSQCADYVLSVFATNGGNPYEPNTNPNVSNFGGQRISFPQISTTALPGNIVSDRTPIQFNNPGTTFCSVPISWLPFTTPGCGFIDSNSVSLDQLLVCMNGNTTTTVSTVPAFSPCAQGVLAFISDDSTNFNINDINNTQLSCVRGTLCPNGQVNIYDTNLGATVCKTL